MRALAGGIILHGGSSGISSPSRPAYQVTLLRRPPMAATFQIAPPESFDFARPQQWEKWIRRFERFRIASGLSAQDDEAQVNTLIYAMGDEADDILRSFGLSGGK